MLIFVRHGQTEDNVKGIATGRTDIPLNETGLQQAELVGEGLKNAHFDVVFVSPLLRARQTAAAILKHHPNTPVFYDERLMEREDGEATGRLLKEVYPNFAWDYDATYSYEGFETMDQMRARIEDFYNEILPQYKGKSVLIVAHDGIGKMSRWIFEGLPESHHLDDYHFSNARSFLLREDW